MKISAVPFAALDPLTAYSLWKLRQTIGLVRPCGGALELSAPKAPSALQRSTVGRVGFVQMHGMLD